MELKLNYFGKVENGNLKIKGRKQFDFELQQFEGKEVEITIKKKRNRRSNNLNRYIHGVLFIECLAAFREVGFDEIKTPEQCKEILKAKFLKYNIVNEKSGEVLESYKNTSELTNTECCAFIDDVIKFAAESLNYNIPYPNEQASIFE